MSVVSTSQIKELREISGAGMMDCKKALAESGGDIEEATSWLRKKGLAKAAKKAGRTAAEGLIAVSATDNKAAMVEVNSETDFVARNEQFQELADTLAGIALKTGQDIDALNAADYGNGKDVASAITETVATIGENINLRRMAYSEVSQGFVASYIHNAIKPGLGKIGVLVSIETDKDNDAIRDLGKQIAMHVAAVKPESLTRDGVDASRIDRERALYKEQAMASGKPEEIAEKMVEGRIRKFYEEVVLLEQPFVIDGKTPVNEVVANVAKEQGATINVTDYKLLVLGEGIEKEESDFAAEVASAAGS